MVNRQSYRNDAPKITHLYKMPVEDDFMEFHLLNPDKSALSNNIPVYQFQSGSHELVKLEFVFTAGSRYQDVPLTASVTNSLLREGSKGYSSFEIADTLDQYGASLLLSCERDRASVGIICMAKYLEKVLPLLESMIKYPLFPEDELKLTLARQKQEFNINMEKVGYVASRGFNETLFGREHPYGQMAESDDFDNLTRKDISEFHINHYSSGNCEIFVSAAKPSETIELLENSFGKIRWGNYDPKNIIWSAISSEIRDIHVIRENAVQSAIRVGKSTISPNHDDFTTLKVLNTLLGGYFGSRLMKNIREEKGLTYGIGSTLVSFEKCTFMVISSEVKADNTRQVLDEVIKEITFLQDTLVKEEELIPVKNFMIGGFLQSFDGPFNFAEKFKERHYLNLEDSYFRDNILKIQRTTAADIMIAAKKYYPVNQMIKLIVGKSVFNN